MTTLLHRKAMPPYYAGEGSWTDSKSGALDFASVDEAVHCAQRQSLSDAEVIIVYQSIQAEVRIPVLPMMLSVLADVAL